MSRHLLNIDQINKILKNTEIKDIDTKGIIDQQPKRRKAEVITPPNVLKKKVGSGGLPQERIEQAEQAMYASSIDFKPIGAQYLMQYEGVIDVCKIDQDLHDYDHEELIEALIYPVMQLKAHGGMFGYLLIAELSKKMIYLLETIESLDKDVFEILDVYAASLRTIMNNNLRGDCGKNGQELLDEFSQACGRYFVKKAKQTL